MTIREEIKKVLNEGSSGDMDGFGCADYNKFLVPELANLFADRITKIKMKKESPNTDLQVSMGYFLAVDEINQEIQALIEELRGKE